MHAVIASGSGQYADSWHPFDETSALLATSLAEAKFTVGIDTDVDHAMRSLDDVDLIVVNAGDPWRDETRIPVSPESVDGFARALDRGIGVLAMHSAVSSLRDYPEWAIAIGGIWVPGASFHPPIGETQVRGARFPDGAAVTDFTVFDERYCGLQRLGRSVVVAEHEASGNVGNDIPLEPAAWVRETGRARVAVDVLGHDARSYESVGHRNLVRQLALWAASVDSRQMPS
jgi:type 1 glutamine amidotransferase